MSDIETILKRYGVTLRQFNALARRASDNGDRVNLLIDLGVRSGPDWKPLMAYCHSLAPDEDDTE